MAKKKINLASNDKESAGEAILKKFKQSPGIYIGSVVILILVIVTFLGGDLLSGGRRFGSAGDDYIFGHYEKTPIAYVPGNYFAENYNNLHRYYQAQGVDVSNFWTSAQLWRMAFEGALTHTALLEIMKKSGYSVPERIVDREVSKLTQFQENGRFSPELYRQTSESTRLSLSRQVQESLVKSVFYNDYYDLFYPRGEAEFIANMASLPRVYEFVTFSVDDFPESEFVLYARNNQSLFNSIHMSKISAASEREARRILSSVRDGTTTFEDAARNQSVDIYSASGGDMGIRYFYELEREITNSGDRGVIYGLRTGEISDIVVTADGWSFFRIENAVKTADLNDEAVMERARAYVRSFERGRMEDWAIARAREFSAQALDFGFEDAAYSWNLARDSFGPLSINYGSVDLFSSLESFSLYNVSSQDLSSMSRNENFWRTILQAQMDTPSSPLVQGSYVFVFVPIEEIKADQETIDNIKDRFSSWWNIREYPYLSYISEQLIQQYFVNSEKTDDSFWEAFFRYFL